MFFFFFLVFGLYLVSLLCYHYSFYIIILFYFIFLIFSLLLFGLFDECLIFSLINESFFKKWEL